MIVLLYLIPAMLLMGGLALAAFLWALKSGQFDDLDGAAERILMDDDDRPAQPPAPSPVAGQSPGQNQRLNTGEPSQRA